MDSLDVRTYSWHKIEEITEENLIEDYNLKLFLTEENY